jgi:putative phosphoesterase
MSDIHCNLEGLEGALARLSDCDTILCAGDLMYQYRFSTDVLALLEDHGVQAITGNHDRTILQTPSHPLREKIDPAALEWLGAVPRTLRLELDGVRIAMFHGAPWDDPEEIACTYVFPDNKPLLRQAAQADADVVVLGHTHRAFATRIAKTLIVNPGSCGESRDGTNLLSCAVFDTVDGDVDFRKWPQ